jgi:hypothetical protein
MFQARLAFMEGSHHCEDRGVTLPGDDSASREAAAIANPFDLKDDRLLWIAAEQEISVKGMGCAGADGPLGCDQRLSQDLTAKDPFPAIVHRATDKAIRTVGLKVEER